MATTTIDIRIVAKIISLSKNVLGIRRLLFHVGVLDQID